MDINWVVQMSFATNTSCLQDTGQRWMPSAASVFESLGYPQERHLLQCRNRADKADML